MDSQSHWPAGWNSHHPDKPNQIDVIVASWIGIDVTLNSWLDLPLHWPTQWSRSHIYQLNGNDVTLTSWLGLLWHGPDECNRRHIDQLIGIVFKLTSLVKSTSYWPAYWNRRHNDSWLESNSQWLTSLFICFESMSH